MKFTDFIERFEKRTATKNGFMVRCPSHDDGSASLSIGKSNNGGVLLKCFAGCEPAAICAALGLTLRDLFATENFKPFTPPIVISKTETQTAKPTIEKIYSYQNENGVEVFQALRLKPKSFRQRHMADGKWVWTMDGVIRVLYQLPKVMASQIVWIVEGEKDADNLAALGFVATCNVGGAGKWLDAYTESIAGKDIVVCGDNDEPGKKHAALVFDSISESAKTVRLLTLPETIKDASDFIASFKTQHEAKTALQSLAEAAHPFIKGHSLPLYTVSEMESAYKQFVRSMGENSFSLGRWLPTLGIHLRDLVPGELVFIIGDTGTGKTGILQQIARAALPLPTLFFEMELPREKMFERFASMSTKMTGREIEAAYREKDDTLVPQMDIHYRNLCVCPVSRLTLVKIENIILKSELKLGERPRVVLIDYIQLIKGEGQSRREKISDIAEELKVMAMATRTIVIVSSQISRPQNPDDDWEPSLHSAKESGSIEASCGVMLGAWQDEKENCLKVRVLKATSGGVGVLVKCNFDGARMIITERSKNHPSNADIPKPYRD